MSAMRPTMALGFVDEFLATGGNGEGWTFEHVEAVVSWGLGRDLNARQQMFVRNILGDAALDGRASTHVAGPTTDHLSRGARSVLDHLDPIADWSS